jgi:hypothetical protein
MVEDLLHDMLRDVAVETGRERFTNPAEYLSLTSGREWHPSSSLRFLLHLLHHADHWMQQK